jgi:carboxymethylenebutenolidase
MPVYEPSHVEYGITNGHIQVVAEDGSSIPAYWAHPVMGRLFPAVALVHDWWGITPIIRRMAHLFAQSGYYVIVPDLFEGQIATTPQEAMELVKRLGDKGYPRIDAALSALEHHHNTNGDVAAVGIGMGGSLAFEAAIVRKDLEAAVSYYGFPQRYFNRFADATTPILAIYGDHEPHVPVDLIDKLRTVLSHSKHNVQHELLILPNAARDFFMNDVSAAAQQNSAQALNATFTFLDKYLKGPAHTPPSKLKPR